MKRSVRMRALLLAGGFLALIGLGVTAIFIHLPIVFVLLGLVASALVGYGVVYMLGRFLLPTIKREQLSLKHHPDKNPNNSEADEKFKILGQAYAILTDTNDRAELDKLRAHSKPAFRL